MAQSLRKTSLAVEISLVKSVDDKTAVTEVTFRENYATQCSV